MKKRYWLWTVLVGDPFKTTNYIDDDGKTPRGHVIYASFKRLNKVKHENEFVDIDTTSPIEMKEGIKHDKNN